jgi:23S rRNA (adenine2030-N6)-methyltransferase
MAILNPPWKLDEALREPLRALARLLSQERPATWTLDWLLQEGEAASAPPRPPAAPSGPRRHPR